MKKLILIICFFNSIIYGTGLFGQNAKKPLDHSVYNDWKSIQKVVISNDGNWVSYEINPQDGDGRLIIYHVNTQKTDTIQRGTDLVFSSDASFAAFKIKPQKSVVRAAKKAKKKKDEMPMDSLGIYNLATGQFEKFAELKTFEVPKKTPGIIAFQIKTPEEKVDTTVSGLDTIPDKKPKDKSKKEEESGRLIFYQLTNGFQKQWDQVNSFTVPEEGAALYLSVETGDSIKNSQVIRFDYKKQEETTVFNGEGTTKELTTDKKGSQAAWLYTPDTSKVKKWQLAWFDGNNDAIIIADTLTPELPKAWCPSENGKLRFSDAGTRLFFGIAPTPRPEPEDTLLDDEKFRLDIWHWQDPLLQTQQLKGLDAEKKKSWTAVYFTKENRIISLQDSLMNPPSIPAKEEAPLAIVTNTHSFLWQTTYDIRSLRDVYVLNMTTGNKQLLLAAEKNPYYVSPDGNYLVLYDLGSNTWYSYNLNTFTRMNISKGLDIRFQDEENDVPLEANPYGIAGWLEKERGVLVYDRYDIWLFDLEGKNNPINYTNAYGRINNIQLRYIKTDPEETHIPANKPLLLSGFHYRNKESGYLRLIPGNKPEVKTLSWTPATFYNFRKAKDAETLIWGKGNFQEYPDLYISNADFENAVRISDANPQMKEYLWGNVELVEWVSFNGDSLQGLLYTPENMAKDKKYPMLVYFYERSSDDLYYHIAPSPSRSIINRAYCTSNDYVVFVPDIVYRNGFPGESAYDAIVSGVHSMLERYPFIDRNKMGLQGQSWGGYQIAWLITQTNMFTCAMAGAPVSNMTSAYGGIRWESGMVRQFQYEQTQSRIGGSLWEKPREFIENSPIFYADKVNTPLLIMANDNDGAVPWYQGIEYFTALRRLKKPVWMLVYNGEEHNLSKRPNMHDLTIRMYQFFDHYLKDQPAPQWLKDGIPAIEKGKTTGY